MIWLIDKIIRLLLLLITVLCLVVAYAAYNHPTESSKNAAFAFVFFWVFCVWLFSTISYRLNLWRGARPPKLRAPKIKRKSAVSLAERTPHQPKTRRLVPPPMLQTLQPQPEPVPSAIPEKLRQFVLRGDEAIHGGSVKERPAEGRGRFIPPSKPSA